MLNHQRVSVFSPMSIGNHHVSQQKLPCSARSAQEFPRKQPSSNRGIGSRDIAVTRSPEKTIADGAHLKKGLSLTIARGKKA